MLALAPDACGCLKQVMPPIKTRAGLAIGAAEVCGSAGTSCRQKLTRVHRSGTFPLQVPGSTARSRLDEQTAAVDPFPPGTKASARFCTNFTLPGPPLNNFFVGTENSHEYTYLCTCRWRGCRPTKLRNTRHGRSPTGSCTGEFHQSSITSGLGFVNHGYAHLAAGISHGYRVRTSAANAWRASFFPCEKAALSQCINVLIPFAQACLLFPLSSFPVGQQ